MRVPKRSFVVYREIQNFTFILKQSASFTQQNTKFSLREKYSNTEFFLVRISLYLD